MLHNSIHGHNQSKISFVPIELACVLYGFFVCLLALCGLVILTLARLYVYPVTVTNGVTRTLVYVGFYDPDVAGQIEDISWDFMSDLLVWETLPISGYGIVFYICLTGSIISSILLCYAIHTRNPCHLKPYLMYGVPVTAAMFPVFFYLFAWFTAYRLYSIIGGAMALYLQLVIRWMAQTLLRLYQTEPYHRLRPSI